MKRVIGFVVASGFLAVMSTSALANETEGSSQSSDAIAGFEATGVVKSCVYTTFIKEIDPIDERNWLVEMRNGDYYLNHVGRGCRGADRHFTHMQYKSYGSNLCKGDTITIIEKGSPAPSGTCGLGKFQELTQLEEIE